MKRQICLTVVATAFLILCDTAESAHGDLYVADSSTRSILRFTPGGTRTTFASDVDAPAALAFDRQGNLFVADADSCFTLNGQPCGYPSKLLRFTAAGERSTFAVLAPDAQVFGMAFDGAYTAVVRSGDRTTGTALVEIFSVSQ